MRPKSAELLQKQCDDFNAKYSVGQRVVVKKDDGAGMETVTREQAWVLQGHSSVILLEGISGCYLLDRVVPITH